MRDLIAKIRPIKWHRQASVRFLFVWIMIAMIAIASAAMFITISLKPVLLAQSSRYIEQVGNKAVNRLLVRTKQIETVAKSQVAIIESSDNLLQPLIRHLSANLANQNNADILSGGYWLSAPEEFTGGGTSIYWRRNLLGMFELNRRYQNDEYYRQQGWFNVALQAEDGGHCVWSPLYTDRENYTPKVTCALPVSRGREDVLGVVSVDMDLSELNEFVRQTAQNIESGYVFLTDKYNRFIAFASSQPLNQRRQSGVLANMLASEYAQTHSQFLSISNSLTEIDYQFISQARKRSGERYNALVRRLQEVVPNLSKGEAEIQAVILRQAFNGREPIHNSLDSTLFATVPMAEDALLEESATAYLFTVPESYWKLGVVLPDQAVTQAADDLVKNSMVFAVCLVAALVVWSFYYLDSRLLRPMRETAQSMSDISELIGKGKHKALKNLSLDNDFDDEVGTVRQAVNILIKQVHDSEEALVAVNNLLEVKVSLRTQELQDTMQRLQASQMQLVQSEKMSMLGQMVAGVAHEVNTPLAYIKNNIMMTEDMFAWYENLQRDTDALIAAYESNNEAAFLDALGELMATRQQIKEKKIKSTTLSLLNDALFGAEQIAELVVDLRVFSSAHESKTDRVNVHELLEKSIKMARTSNDKYRIIRHFDTDLPDVPASPSQLIQVFLNLLNNAGHALQDKVNADVTITTRHSDDKAYIDIADNGVGMLATTVEKIFEPFYTTKPAGEGTGLGIPICKQIIERHSGDLSVKSTFGKGTIFTIMIPINRVKPMVLPSQDTDDKKAES